MTSFCKIFEKKNAIKWNFSWNTQQRMNHENWIIVFMIYFIIWVLRLLVKQRVIFDKFCWKFNKHLLHVEASVLIYILPSIRQIRCVVQVDAIQKKQQIRCLFKMNFKNWLILCMFLFIPLKNKRDCNKSRKWQTNENEPYHSMAEHPHLYIQNAEIMAFVFD